MNAPAKTSVVNVHEAKTHLSRLLDRVKAGEEIVLAKAGKPWAKLVPIPPEAKPERRPGRFRDALSQVSYEDVMAPCYTDEELDEIENASMFPE